MNENLSEYILRQQRGYEYTPTPGITPEQLNSFNGKNRTSKRNLCPVCGNNHGCQILDDDAVNCLRTKEHNVPPGWKVAKDLGGLGSTVVREREQTEEEKQQQREQWQRQQEERKIREQERKAVALTDEQIDTEARKIFKQLGLTTNHRKSLRDRGLTDEQIDLIGSVSVDKFQELKLISVNPNFPGMGDKGTLTNSGKGFLIPVRNIKGQITGVQYARDDRNPKYQWFFGSSERRVSGELPLQFLKVNDSRELNIIEGTLKPLVAAHLHNINVLGDGGCRWSSSPEELQIIIDSNQFDSYILNPDTGSLLNDNVMGGYTAFYLFLKSRDIALYVRDWGQGDKPKADKLDVDEIDSETFNSAEIKTFEEWVGMDEMNTTTLNININQPGSTFPLWNQGAISEYLSDKYRDKLAWNIELQSWYRYGVEIDGIWGDEPVEVVKQLINTELKVIAAQHNQFISNPEKFKNVSSQLISSIEKLMTYELGQKKWNGNDKNLIPFKNGVLNLLTKQFTQHCPGNRLTWCLPYDYNLLADSKPIQDWMLEMFGSPKIVEFIRAYLNAIITSRTDLQSFLELIGPGGTGKSSLIRLAMALVGVENCHTTTLNKLENNNFETANIYGKKLVIISDSDRYNGQVAIFKSLTGQDAIPFEIKFKQARGGFTPDAMVIVAANEIPQCSDYTSGLQRRRKTIAMTKQIDEINRRDLISVGGNQIGGEFAPYIPGLLNWVLALSPDDVGNIIKGYDQLDETKATKADALLQTNPMADWLDHCLTLDFTARSQVGVATKNKDSSIPNIYQNVDTWLYASYSEYITNTGGNPINLRRFTNLFEDLVISQLKLPVTRGRDNKGSHFMGIRIRRDSDIEPGIITGVTAKLTKVTDTVTAETLTSDGSDGSDGKNQLINQQEQTLSNPESLVQTSGINERVEGSFTKCHHIRHQMPETPTSDGLQPSRDDMILPSPSVTSITGKGFSDSSERSPEPQPEPIPSEPEHLDFDHIKEGDILFDNLGQPHQITGRTRQLWETHRKQYISRNDILTGQFHRATIEDITKLIKLTIKGRNKIQAQWLCDVYGGEPDSLMAKAIDSNPEKLALIFDFDDWG